MILLIVERQNPNLNFPDNWVRFLPGRRNAQNKKKDARAIQDYLRGGELTDNLLDYLICLGERRSRSCSLIRTAIRHQSAHRDALRKIHDAAARIKWKGHHLAHSGRMARSGMFVAQADLILDHALIEIKAVQSGCHHERHLGQLFAYYLVSQAPVERVHPFEIEQLAIYYARHGTLIKHPVSKLIRFPTEHVKLIAFNFLAECELQRFGGDQKWRNDCFNRVLRAVSPRPSWLREALDREQGRAIARWKSNLHDSRVRRINVPDGFLVALASKS